MIDPPTRVAICALTLWRPQGLDALLGGLARLERPGPDIEVRVVIVDNDPEGSAQPIVDAARPSLLWPVDYAVQPIRGIPYGRNKAVETAGPVDFVAFIDDDEVPNPRWLVELLAVQLATEADVVTGPTIPVFPSDAPAWIVQGRFFERDRHPTGQALDFARTSNVLIAADVLAANDPPFDEAYALTGGEDTHFFERARMQGRRIVWADDAIVKVSVPRSRMTARWVLSREYRKGNTLSLCLRDLDDRWARRARRVAHGVIRILQGLVETPIGVPQGRVGIVQGLRRVCLGAGMLTGLVRLRFREYERIHGT